MVRDADVRIDPRYGRWIRGVSCGAAEHVVSGRITVVGLGPATTFRDARRVPRSPRHHGATCARLVISAHLSSMRPVSHDVRRVYDSAGPRRVYTATPTSWQRLPRSTATCVRRSGSPLVLERSVRQLRERDDVEVEVMPAMSFLDLAYAALGSTRSSRRRLVDVTVRARCRR